MIWPLRGARDRPEDIAPDHYIKANPREPLRGRRRDLTQKREKPPRARTKNKTLGPGRHRRFGGVHQWEGEPCLACELSTRGSF